MANIKSIVNRHNKEVITEKKTQAVNCNCINKPDCTLSYQCQITNIIYKAKIISNLRNYNGKIYYGTSEGTFKQRYGNHKKSLNYKKYRTDKTFEGILETKKTQSTTSSTTLYFKKMTTDKKNRYLLTISEQKTVYH